MTTHALKASPLTPDILVSAVGDAFKKLSPRQMARNPVMFVVEILAVLVTVLFIRDLVTGAEPASPRRGGSRRSASASWSQRRPSSVRSASSVNLASTFCCSI
jgi:hypothetical protein